MERRKGPEAIRRPRVRDLHGERVVDNYAWLRERDCPAVRSHLAAENLWAETANAGLVELQEQLFEEFRSRVQESDESAPVRHGDWWYFKRAVEGCQYPLHCRRSDGATTEEVVLDEGQLADGAGYCKVGALEPSPDQRLLALTVDFCGNTEHVLRVLPLAGQEHVSEEIRGTSAQLAWANDSKCLFYTALDRARRPWRVYRHSVGSDPAEDALLYEETDERFHLSLGKLRSHAYVKVCSNSVTTSEVRLLDADDPDSELLVVAPRRTGISYDVEHQEPDLFILTNEEAVDFRVLAAPAHSIPGLHRLRTVVPHREGVRIQQIVALAGHLVAWQRREGLPSVRVVNLGSGDSHELEFPEPAYSVRPEENQTADTSAVRLRYSSFVTPESVYDYDMERRTWKLLEQRPVLKGYDPNLYECRRLTAVADDGTGVPLSVVFRKGLVQDASAPCLLEGYGAYEASRDPCFCVARLSLLDRGFVCAIAHVRGGGELGRGWYEGGRLLRKPNTFTDFIACAEHLVAEGYASPQRIVARGESAGGLLVGAVMNMRPQLFRAVVAEVPFVDIVNTMLDPALPLTVTEFDEWGDPSDPTFYRCMASYAPYENVAGVGYPAMFATTALEDAEVACWEPMKWVARLRSETTGHEPLILRVSSSSGHEGPSGRYDAWREEARKLAFVLDAVGLNA